MKKYLPFIMISGSLFAVNPTKQIQQEEKMLPQVTAATQSRQGEVMIINPSDRAKDLQSAFQYLQKQNANSKIYIKLTDGKTLSDIADMDVMPGGTIIIFRSNTLKGTEYKVENIENIASIYAS